jgi:LmbE family N-acetylglucosaminyl deacetylase
LFVVPHPDDLEISCGILVQKLVAEGHAVKAVIVCTGVPFSREKNQREAEAVAACKLLGVEDVVFLRYASFSLTEQHWQVKEDIERIVHDFEPNMLFVPWAQDVHEDHAVVSELSLVAGRSVRTVYLYPAISAERFEPDTLVVGTKAMLDIKVRAIGLHKSQVELGRIDPSRAAVSSGYWLSHFGHHSQNRVNKVDVAQSSAEVLKLYRQEFDI